ncbi:hypothetical protein [Novosphingobium sp. FKTRR1]|uniref:hypothetical protein n=1 Tax=unclassified Novosphingobium TaxID=2644732 RepID=UPI001CF00525|nr:hypothetical protein [Novosphingobium sp. FKTRR1]
MMDEAWTRHWVAARDAARVARAEHLAEAARKGTPAPSLWGDLRALVRDLINPPTSRQPKPACGEPENCQSAA